MAGENGLALNIDDFNASFWLSLEYISPYGCGSEFAVPVYYHVLPEMQSPMVMLEAEPKTRRFVSTQHLRP